MFEVFIDNLVDPFDHDHPVDLYYGFDETGRSLFVDALMDSKSTMWTKFKTDLKERNYYLFEEDALNKLEVPLKRLQRKISENTELFRSRIGYLDKEVDTVLEDFKQKIKSPYSNSQLKQPPSYLAQAGRSNRQGISFLYLASDKNTSISEVRPDPGNYVSVGKFVCTTNLTLIDLRFIDLEKYYKNADDFELFELFRDLAIDLSHPVLPSERNKYLVTQFLSDIIRKLNYDGLIFSSSVSNGDNYVMFNPDQFEYVEKSSSLVKIQKMKPAWPEQIIRSHKRMIKIYSGYQGFANF